MSMITAWATWWLESAGHVVLEPSFLAGENVFANAGPFTVLRRDAPYKVVPATARVLQAGETVAPAVPAGMPEPGVYVPSVPGHAPRTVTRCVGAYVFCDKGRSCTLPSWERWVRKAKARVDSASLADPARAARSE